MPRLCGRPGCSESGVVAYGMVPEDLLFWIAPLADSPVGDPSMLCRRHADAMVVPRGWTLDDRRENALRLFKPRPIERADPAPRRPARRTRSSDDRPEQLQIDGTGEITRPPVPDEPEQAVEPPSGDAPEPPPDEPSAPQPGGSTGPGASTGDDAAAPWRPAFDHDDDLGGLLEVSSPLLSRAFRGTGRTRH